MMSFSHQRLSLCAAASALVLATVTTAPAQLSVTKTSDSVIDAQALLMPAGSTYGRAINGVAFQASPLVSHNGHQYTAWYRKDAGTEESLILARRSISGQTVGTWEVHDTGWNFTNGDDGVWDAHNVVSLGISKADGTLHLAWDHHLHNLRYAVTKVGVANGTVPWGSGMFNGGERNTLLGTTVGAITYPNFVNTPSGDLQFVFRTGASNDGRSRLTTYANGAWSAPKEIVGSTGTYTETYPSGSSHTSTSRFGYPNGFTYGSDGKLHTTFVWRETGPYANHDLNYAYSEDGGITWKNNAGAIIADTAVGDSMLVTDPGLVVAPLNMRQSLYNQQGQAVDREGGLHTVVVHRRNEPGYEYRGTHPQWDPVRSAYHHYYRDPRTGEWSMHRLPLESGVGARAAVGVDAAGNVYAVYTNRGPEDGDEKYNVGHLVIAGATAAAGYADWSVLHVEDVEFIGEPLIDAQRLIDDGILSVFIQENAAATGAVGSPLHVIEFAVPEPGAGLLVMAGVALVGTRRRRSAPREYGWRSPQ